MSTENKKPEPKLRLKKNPNAEKFYVAPEELRSQIQDFYNTDKMSNDLGRNILKVVNGLGSTRRFNEYSYLDEMKSDATMKIVRAISLKNFKVDTKTNPFSYFTTIAFHAFCNRIKLEKKNRETIDKLQVSIYDDLISENSDFKEHILEGYSPDRADD